MSYVVADPATDRAAIIDSVLDFDAASGRTQTASADLLIGFVRDSGLTVDWILDRGHKVMLDLNSKRGKIQGMEQVGGRQRINALVPQAEVARYVIDLRSMTGGRGAFTMTFSHYEEMPQHLAQKVIDEYQKAREEGQKR